MLALIQALRCELTFDGDTKIPAQTVCGVDVDDPPLLPPLPRTLHAFPPTPYATWQDPCASVAGTM